MVEGASGSEAPRTARRDRVREATESDSAAGRGRLAVGMAAANHGFPREIGVGGVASLLWPPKLGARLDELISAVHTLGVLPRALLLNRGGKRGCALAQDISIGLCDTASAGA